MHRWSSVRARERGHTFCVLLVVPLLHLVGHTGLFVSHPTGSKTSVRRLIKALVADAELFNLDRYL